MRINLVVRLVVALALWSWMLAGTAQAQTQIPSLSSEPPLITEIVDETNPPLPLDPQDPPPLGDLVDELEPLLSTVVDITESSFDEVLDPGDDQPSAEPSARQSAVGSGGATRSVAQVDDSDAADAPDDLEDVAAAGQQIAPAQVLSETQSANQGPALSFTGFHLIAWMVAAALSIVVGALCMWISRPSRRYRLSKALPG